jgi:hypothetical protein
MIGWDGQRRSSRIPSQAAVCAVLLSQLSLNYHIFDISRHGQGRPEDLHTFYVFAVLLSESSVDYDIIIRYFQPGWSG